MRKRKLLFIATSVVSLTCLALDIIWMFLLSGKSKFHFAQNISGRIFGGENSFFLSFPKGCTERGQWLDVSNDKSVYVYSAYYIRKRQSVYVIGLKPYGTINMICQLWFRHRDVILQTSQARVRLPDILQKKRHRYVPTIFVCPLKSTDMPFYVSLVSVRSTKPSAILCVNNASEPTTYQRLFTVCLSPLYNDVNPLALVEWVEINRILGAEKFLVYNHSATSSVDRVLNYYVKLNLMEIVQWQFPFPATEIYTHGQIAALNDCLFRSKSVSAFTVNTDMDELIIPHARNMTTWSQVIAEVSSSADVYVFRSVFFINQNQTAAPDIYTGPDSLITFKRTVRNTDIFPVYLVSKHITRTANVDWVQVHKVPCDNNVTVSVQLAIVHHYRSRVRQVMETYNDTTIIDKYKRIIILRIKKVFRQLLIN